MTENPTTAAAAGAGAGRWRTLGVITVAVAALIAGVTGSWKYNSGYSTRAADDSAIIVTGADLPAFVNRSSGSHAITMPIANDSPYQVTVYQVTFTNAPGITWGGANAVIKPGQTANLTVTTPADCPVTVPPGPMPTASAKAVVRVRTVSGKPHGINLYFSGVLAYAAEQCKTAPSATSTP